MLPPYTKTSTTVLRERPKLLLPVHIYCPLSSKFAETISSEGEEGVETLYRGDAELEETRRELLSIVISHVTSESGGFDMIEQLIDCIVLYTAITSSVGTVIIGFPKKDIILMLH